MSNLADLLEKRSRPDSANAGQRYFVSQQKQIEQAIKDRWTLKDIYRALNDDGRMPVAYRTFTHYVSKFITDKKHDQKKQEPKHNNDQVSLLVEDNAEDKPIRQKLPRGLGGSSAISAGVDEEPENHKDSEIFS